jgi:hypothetical protein
MSVKPRKPTDWRKRFNAPKAPHVVMLHADFAGVKAGNTMLISSPGEIANYLGRIPHGETRTVDRLRNELARKAGANSMCPVTTAIYLRVVAEVALANEVFTPSDAAVADARAILAAMEEAKANGQGATTYKGKLIDIASMKQAEVIVKQYELIMGA